MQCIVCRSTIENVSSLSKDDSQIGNMFQFSLHNDSLYTNEIDYNFNHRMNDSNISSTLNEPDTTITDMDAEVHNACNMYEISFESEKISNSIDPPTVNKTKKKYKKNIWTEGEVFGTFDEAHDYLNNYGFGSRDVKYTSQGKKTYYTCKAVARRAKNKCDAQRIISEPATETSYKILYTGVHTHDDLNEEDLSKRMTPEMTKFIISQRKKNMSADNIIKSIGELKKDLNLFPNDKVPTRKQIYYIATKHRLAETPPIVSIGELVEWCQKHSDIQEDEDEPFVFAYEHSNEGEDPFFRFAVSTF